MNRPSIRPPLDRTDRFSGITGEITDTASARSPDSLSSASAIPASQLRPDDDFTISELLRVLHRRRRVIAATIVLLTAAPTLYGLRLEPAYTAVASVMIAPRDSRIMEVGDIRAETVPDAATLETQSDILRSRGLFMLTMEDLQLFSDPEFQVAMKPDTGASALISTHAVPEWLQGLLQDLHNWWRSATAALDSEVAHTSPDVPAVPKEQREREAAVRVFGSNLEVVQSGKAYVLHVAFSSKDPVKAATIVNRLTQLYVERQLQDKIAATQKATLWLTDRLRTQQQDVLDAEHAVADFRSKYQFVAGKGAALTETRLDQINRALIETQTTAAEKQSKLQLIRRLKAKGHGLDAIAEAIESPLISELRKKQAELVRQQADLAISYGENHPATQANHGEIAKLTASIADELNRIVRALQNELTVLATQEHALEQQFEAAKAQSARDNQAGVQLEELEREAAAKRTLYETLLSRYQETNAQEGILEPDAQVISPAEIPTDTSTPSPMIFAAVGFAASAVFGCMLALLKEQLDDTLRNSRDVERSLGLACVGLVPSVTLLERGQTLHGYLSSKPQSPYVQAVRALHIQLIAAEPPPRVILITSALPDEGKTSLAAGLAVCAAQAGAGKTLLVDFDLWRPKVADDFGLEPASGIADLIGPAGDQQQRLEQALIIDHATGIDILPAGRYRRRGRHRIRRHAGTMLHAEFLTPQAIYRLLAELRKRYDYIVLDSPPLLGVSDGRILSMHADATVFVARWGHTSRDAALAGVRILRDISASIFGVVLSRVDLKKHVQYGHGDGVQFHESFRKYYPI